MLTCALIQVQQVSVEGEVLVADAVADDGGAVARDELVDIGLQVGGHMLAELKDRDKGNCNM